MFRRSTPLMSMHSWKPLYMITSKQDILFLKASYFSDGFPAQYKNYKNFTNLLMHKKVFGMKAEWHFFATSHGKNTSGESRESRDKETCS